MFSPKTGVLCTCKRSQQRDNCPQCEGTGKKIDFAAIRRVTAAHRALNQMIEGKQPEPKKGS